MTLRNLLDGLRRAPWLSVARHLLLRAGYDTARGFERTVKAALAEREDPAKVQALQSGLSEHTVAGEKFVQIVQLQPGERVGLENWIRSKRKHRNALSDAFPGIAAENDVRSLYNKDPTSVGCIDLEVGVASLFTATRSYVQSVTIPPSSLRDGVASGFERVIGFKKVYAQVYDAIWLPAQGDFVILAADYPAEGPKQEFPRQGLAYISHQLKHHLGRPISVANLWQAVDGLYCAPDGKLVDYGFSAGGQSVNHHKARRHTALCLRKAVYDLGGAAAVKAAGKSLDLFKVAMQWATQHADGTTTEPEVLLPGTAGDLNRPMAVIDHCVVRGCLTSKDLDFAVSKLTPHIKRWV